MTARAVVTQLNTHEAAVWEPYSTLLICLQVCVCACVCVCSVRVRDEYEAPAGLKCLYGCMFVHLYMYVWVKFICVCTCACACVCVVLQLLLGWLVFILAWSQTFITSLLIAPFLHPSVPPAIYKSTADCLSLRANIQSFFFSSPFFGSPLLSSPLLSSPLLFHTVVYFVSAKIKKNKKKTKKKTLWHPSFSQPNRPNLAKLEHIRASTLYSFSPLTCLCRTVCAKVFVEWTNIILLCEQWRVCHNTHSHTTQKGLKEGHLKFSLVY